MQRIDHVTRKVITLSNEQVCYLESFRASMGPGFITKVEDSALVIFCGSERYIVERDGEVRVIR